MAHVMKKINEMQMKLNLINENIEEIKNVQKNLEKKNKKSNSIYSKNNSVKNHHQNRVNKEIKNNSNPKFIYKKNLSKSSKLINFNMNKTSYNNKKEKSLKFNNSQVYNNYEFQDIEHDIQDDNISQKSLMFNYKDKKIGYSKKNRTSLSSFDNDRNSFMEQKNHEFNYNSKYLSQINDYLYNKISINKNNCYFKKKGLNYSNYIDKSDNKNNNGKNNLDNVSINNYKNKNLITTKNNIKIKKLSEQNENGFNRNNIINNYGKKFDFNNIIIKNKKRVFYGIKEQNNKNRKKGIDLEQNYPNEKKENIINNYLEENNKNNSMTAKNKIRNSSFHGLNYINSNINNSNSENIIYFKKKKTLEQIPDINSRNQLNLFLDEQKLKFNENLKEDEKNSLPSNIYTTKMKHSKIIYDKNNKNHIQNNNNKNTKDIKYEQILLDIINITNQYNNKQDKINIDNVIDEYKMLLNNMKIKNEFIYNLINIYNNSTKSNLNCREPKSLILIWNWIINKQDNIENNLNSNNEDIQYRKLCQEIMKQYKLKNIDQLKIFINNSFRKIDNNDNFLEGIKKILLEK